LRAKSQSLVSIAAIAVATVSSAVRAQDAGTGQPGPATAAATATAPAAEQDLIIVTGVRAALQSAAGLKRRAPQIVDSVVAEDIGKLPDISVADTAARIAGVQVYRQAGEASNVLVRGLPFFGTTYNGREIFTAETRVVALQDFPSQNIAALNVFKTSTADLVEPGLAGLVNVVSRMPFDFAGTVFSASAQTNFSRNAEEFKPQGNFLFSKRWTTGLGDMGFLINGSYTELRYLDNEVSNTDFIATPNINGQTARLPDIQRLFDRSGNRTRPSVNAAFQWRPSGNLEVYAEVLWQGFRNRIDDRLYEVPLYGGQSYSNLTFRPGTNLVTGGTVINPGQIFTFQGATYNTTDTFQYAGGLKWKSGHWKASTDIARTTSTFRGSTESLDRRYLGPHSVTFDTSTPQFSVGGFNPYDASAYTFQGLYEENQRSAGRGWQGRADIEYDFDNSFLKNIQAGARYTDRGATRQFGNRYSYLLPLGINAATLPIQYNVFATGFAGTDAQGLRGWVSPTYDGIRSNLTALRQFVINACPAIVANGDLGNGCRNYTVTPVNAGLQYNAYEETLAGYVQANYAFGDLVDGTVGVRVERTRERVQGPQPAQVADFNRTNEFTDYLPDVSARVHLGQKAQLRLSFTQTRTLPNFSDLNPNVSLGAPPSQGKGTPENPQGGSAGNPFLKPYTSDNYDASLEYYFSRTGFVSAAYFHRSLNGFIQRGTIDIPNDPIYGYVRLGVPFNTGKGRIDGGEVQGQAFLDIPSLPKWVQGFGIQAALTFLDAKTQQFDPTLNGGAGGLRYDRIVDQQNGTSSFLYSVVGLYERGPFSARVTWNGRSSFLAAKQYRGNDYYYEIGLPPQRIDMSLNYNIGEHATVFFDWTNVTTEPFRQNFSSARDGAPRADYVRYNRYDESVMSAGVRLRLGK
jgi:iron complex outermembrane receptor protein